MLIRAIQRAAVYHKLLCQLVDQCMIEDEEKKKDMKKESSDIVFAAADLAHVRCAKLIGFRSEQNAQLNPTDFYRLASVMRTFIQQCETYCERTCFGLRGTVLSQVNLILFFLLLFLFFFFLFPRVRRIKKRERNCFEK